MMASTLIAEGIETIVNRTYGPGPSMWESLLPEPALRMPAELVRVDTLLADPVFFEPLRPFFHTVAGRSSTPT